MPLALSRDLLDLTIPEYDDEWNGNEMWNMNDERNEFSSDFKHVLRFFT